MDSRTVPRMILNFQMLNKNNIDIKEQCFFLISDLSDRYVLFTVETRNVYYSRVKQQHPLGRSRKW